MPDIEVDELNDTVVYWAKTGSNQRNESTFDTPVELDARWELSRRVGADPQGNKIVTTISAAVKQSVTLNGLMWLGTLVELAALALPAGRYPTDVCEILTYDEADDIKGRITRREVGLNRYKVK